MAKRYGGTTIKVSGPGTAAIMAALTRKELELAAGTLESGPSFRVMVSNTVTPDQIRGIAGLLHALATKSEQTALGEESGR